MRWRYITPSHTCCRLSIHESSSAVSYGREEALDGFDVLGFMNKVYFAVLFRLLLISIWGNIRSGFWRLRSKSVDQNQPRKLRFTGGVLARFPRRVSSFSRIFVQK
jgi:hypothetical protein